ncbi:MAG: hypothetical protein M3Y27_18685 [Acidobacteriota bacterium]|nr:hypothetical protein [Acidobacteriota bacterium]
MKIGTRSVLFGAHQFLLHPVFLAFAWRKLYGFPWDLRLWAAFFVHDLGYLGSGDMDGSEGEKHVELGAHIMRTLFGNSWGEFCGRHSRYYARSRGLTVSRLCVADKLAFVLTPNWLYLPMTRATGEIFEYIERSVDRQAGDRSFRQSELALLKPGAAPADWLKAIKSYTARWVEANQFSADHCNVRGAHQYQEHLGRQGGWCKERS